MFTRRLRAALARLAGLAGRDARDRELAEELEAHLQMQVEENLCAGMVPGEARRRALVKLGGPTQAREECRRRRGFPVLEDLWQDLRYGARTLAKQPGFTAVALLSVALGVGGNAAIFSLVNQVLIRPLPYAEPHRLLRVTEAYPRGAVVALQEHSRTMDVAAFTTDSEFNLTGQGEAARLVGSQVSANLFSVLGVSAGVGRTFEAGEDRPARDDVVILSHALWRGKFGGDPHVVGRPIAVDGVARRVVGVMPPGFSFPSAEVQMWVPARLDPGDKGEYWEHGWMSLVARLRPGATLAQAQGELRSLISRVIIPLFPWPVAADWNAKSATILLHEDLTSGLRGKLLLLLAAVACVLLIACANVASLLLARVAARQREIAVRAALGAGRGRIVRQLLTESAVLAFAGAGLGLLLATSSLSLLKSMLPADNGLLAAAALDWQVLAFVTALALLSGLAFGIMPALNASRMDLAASLKTRSPRAGGPAGARLRSSLIVGEVALAVALVIGAGLLIKSLWLLTQEHPGFDPGQVVTVRVYPQQSAGLERAPYVAFYEGVLRRARAVGGVLDVAAANTTPLSGEVPALPVELEGHPFIPGQNDARMLWAGAVTPDYFKILRIPLLAGRPFTEADSEKTAEVVLVSAATARKYWPGENPVGKQLRILWEQRWRTVVGVVGDVRQHDLSGRAPEWIEGAFYMPYPQSTDLNRQLPAAMTLILRTAANAPQAGADLRKLVASVNPDLPVSEVRPLGVAVAASASPARSLMWLFVGFGGVALFLATIGVYGVVSYSMAQRTYEIGVRMAFGATSRRIFGLVLGQSFRLVLTGLVLGALASLALTRLMTGFLYGVTATDPVTFAGVSLLLLGVALLAGYVPAARAAAINPLVALRHE